MKRDSIGTVVLIETVIDFCIKGELIPVAVTVLVVRHHDHFFKRDLRHMIYRICRINIYVTNRDFRFLLFVCQEYVAIPVFLYKHLITELPERYLHLFLEIQCVLIDRGNHKCCQVFHIAFEGIHMLDHEQHLQKFYVKSIQSWVPTGSCDHNAVSMINKVIDRTVESIKRNQDSFPFLFVFLCSLLKERQHGALAIRHVLATGAILPDRCQHISQKLELIGDERIHLREIIRILI